MAKLPLFKRNPGVSNLYAQFPADFHHVADAEVDDHLLPQLLALPRWCWGVKVDSHTSYALYQTTVAGRSLHHYLHSTVWEMVHGPLAPGFTVDHRDFDGLHNTLANLRPSDASQRVQYRRKYRMANGVPTSSRFKGVRKDTSKFLTKPWMVRIKSAGGRQIYLGNYSTEEEAAYAYDVASRALHGAYGVRNDLLPGTLTPLQEAAIEALVRGRLGLVSTP